MPSPQNSLTGRNSASRMPARIMCGGILRDCATEDRGMSPLSKSEHVINLDALGHSWSGGAPPCFTFMASHIPTSMRRSMSAESSFRAVLGVGRTCDATCAAVSSEHGDGILRVLRTGKRARGSGCTSGNSRRLPPSREHYTCCVVSFDAASRNRQSLLHHLDVRNLEDQQCRSSRPPQCDSPGTPVRLCAPGMPAHIM